MIVVGVLVGILLAGSLVYCGMVVAAAWSYYKSTDLQLERTQVAPSISVLKPLAGAEEDLSRNLRSFFEQQYETFELIFAVRTSEDPALAIVQALRAEYPDVPSHVIVTGEPPYPNAKVYSLSAMTRAATHDVLVMSDSDIRVHPLFLSLVGREVANDNYDLATCPYRAVAGGTFWSRLEALGMNTEFWGGVLVARLVEGVKFTIGPTTIARRQVLQAVPWDSLSRYLAEDFVLGQRAAALGFRVELSHCVVEHRLASDGVRANLLHRLRWARSTRRSRPAGYLGQAFTYPIVWALVFMAVQPRFFWPILTVTALVRGLSVYAVVGPLVLKERFFGQNWLLVPVQDVLGFLVWLSGFSGNSIRWRGRQYRLNRDGTFDLIP